MGEWAECAYAGCKRIFSPDKNQRFCSKSCARAHEADERRPTVEAEIDKALAALKDDLLRMLRR